MKNLEIPYLNYEPTSPVCECGRANVEPPHCRRCGSTNVYGNSSEDGRRMITNIANDGSRVYVEPHEVGVKPLVAIELARGFRCRRCRTYYNESQECKAPRQHAKQQRALMTRSEQRAQARSETFWKDFPGVDLSDKTQKLECLALVAEMKSKYPKPLDEEKRLRLEFFMKKPIVPFEADAPPTSMRDALKPKEETEKKDIFDEDIGSL